MNGSLINFSSIARDVGVADKTVKSYFQILEDTLIGFFLPPYHCSITKTQLQAPRFFLFDCGIKRALEGTLSSLVQPSTSSFGAAFEHFLTAEMMRQNSYGRKNFQFFYLKTQAGAEIDLIIERPGNSSVLLEIKSTTDIREDHLKHLRDLSSQFERPEVVPIELKKG
jgi:predicted AAA+ superfamily ATPase